MGGDRGREGALGRSIRGLRAGEAPGVRVGIGDDWAVLDVQHGCALLATTDGAAP